MSRKYAPTNTAAPSSEPPSKPGIDSISTRATATIDAAVAAPAMSRREDRSAIRPKMRPPISDATPEARMKPPSPASAPVPEAIDIVTMNGGLSDDTSSRPRTEMNFRNVASSRKSRAASANQEGDDSSDAGASATDSGSSASRASPAGSRTREYTDADSAHSSAPTASRIASAVWSRSSPPSIRMSTPRVMATSPAADVARPTICPRSPDGMVRPCTSFDAIEHRHRPSENTTSAARIPTPAAVPCPSAAIAAITATDTACTAAPVTKTHFRRRTRTTSGVRNACGSIDPDSRIGTSRPTKAAGTPRTWNSHGSTVEALTVWSPDDCSVLAATRRRPLRGRSRRTGSGSSCSASSDRVTRRE